MVENRQKDTQMRDDKKDVDTRGRSHVFQMNGHISHLCENVLLSSHFDETPLNFVFRECFPLAPAMIPTSQKSPREVRK
jgi:hypothetical protein